MRIVQGHILKESLNYLRHHAC